MLLELSTAIGTTFDVRKVTVHEALSSLFTVDVECVGATHAVDLEAIVGGAGSLKASTGHSIIDIAARNWGGIVVTAEQVHGMQRGRDGDLALSTYFIRIVPRLWLLTQRTNHRIFQHLSIPDIIDKLLQDWAIQPTWKIDRGSYPKLEYKVQYGENDFSFFCRLMEEAGITYVFSDQEGDTKLVLNDKPTTNPLRSFPPISYQDNHTEAKGNEFVENVRMQAHVKPGGHQLADFDFRNPAFKLNGEGKKISGPENQLEQYQYKPGSFLIESKSGGNTPTADDKGVYRYDATYGGQMAQHLLDGDRAGKRIVHLETNIVQLEPGTVFVVEGHPNEQMMLPLMVTAFSLATPLTKWDMKASAVFVADPYRPLAHTPKPTVKGVQSATIVGPSGQEIHVDEFGRVRAQFPWDRDGKGTDESSVWMRVGQGWSGTGFGMINIPRIGQEVLIGFLDGDPDNPIIVGRVFNALNPVLYKLPDNKTISGWRTESSPKNGGYNEFKLEDRADKELIYQQAQRDMHELVKRDHTKLIKRKHHRTVEDDQHFVVKKIKKELIEIDDHLHVKGDRYQKIDKSTSLTVGVDQQEKVGNKHALDAGKEIHLKAGSDVVVEAGQNLTIKAAGGFIHIHPGGIDISGILVKINSGGSAGSGSGSSPTVPIDAEEAKPYDNWEDIEKNVS